MIKRWWKRFASFYEVANDAASLKTHYASLPTIQLQQLDPKQLTSQARSTLAEELGRREQERAKRTKVAS
ncbi:hypothetical protein [Pelagicoccus sp. SDUM812005]|uniref:hypothetical protein n=1 Tax=Pelagicoccus sp. SDUM812005 TaxID=3041257 RepID=UPI00280E6C2D|nr:hypothetical protein [Pelagicoccus sp. SDUM812005]MDQ8182243.1 hypothetical protein [Pelagicoccus sp. SDUM812005]